MRTDLRPHQLFPLIKLKNLRKLAFEVLLIAITCVYLYPLYVVVIMSVKTPKDILFNTLGFPTAIQWVNFAEAYKIMNFGNVFLNSLIITLSSSIGIATISGMASFTIAKRAGKFYTFLYYVIISGLMIPFYMTLSSLMKLVRDLGLMNSHLGLIVTYIGRSLPFAIFLYVGFIRGISNEITEAAIIDGCSPWQLYWRIMFPITKHATSTLIILNALSIWNDFLLPLLMLTSKKKMTIPIVQRLFYSEYNSKWQLAFAAFLLGMLPMLVFYFIMQKNIVEGIAAGAVKG